MMEAAVRPAPSLLDDTLAHAIVSMVNEAYEEGERGMWQPGQHRTSLEEVRMLAKKQELLLATVGDQLVGSVHVKIQGSEGMLGMLSVSLSERRGGVGRKLIAAAEDHCRAAGCTSMQLELLTPKGWVHPTKKFLDEWYRRIGYVPLRTKSFDREYPHSMPLMTGPCDFTLYSKPLVPSP
eukprot:GGOE01036623.1.p1 GENE.GGOE01036623.1~~GGOE01036623.1.p1  ORF type:complete len:180 (-),score=47.78 GGOE01036623.1:184-723(-)